MLRWKLSSTSFAVITLFVVSTACTETRTTLGQAYVAPATLHLHSDTSSKSSTVAEAKHGDPLEIVDVQRRSIRVRTSKGVEGWVDSSQLLSPDQMVALKQRQLQESALPPEGTATAYEALNIHIDPDRQSPAFAQIPETGSVTVLGHKLVAKIPNAPRVPGLVVARPQGLSRKQRKEQKSASISFRVPPRPPAPRPPANWLELSAERIDGGTSPEAPARAPAVPIAPPKDVKPATKPEAKPVVMEDWTLVRTKGNRTGWVLTRNLLMSIPDEVAQYAEGKNITAFFDMGTVNDDVKGPKHNWLWTTSSHGSALDFDSWRVFLWNNHKHRYETSFRQRDLEGYFPIKVVAADPGSLNRMFSIPSKDEDGKMRVRSYTFDGHLVHLANTADYNLAAQSTREADALNTQDLAAKVKPSNWFRREYNNVKHRLFGN